MNMELILAMVVVGAAETRVAKGAERKGRLVQRGPVGISTVLAVNDTAAAVGLDASICTEITL